MAGLFGDDLFQVFQDSTERESGSRGGLDGSKVDRVFSQIAEIAGNTKAERLGDDSSKKTKTEEKVVEVMPRLQTHRVETSEACTHELS